MSGTAGDPRVVAARQVLADQGYGEVPVRASGHQGEIAVLHLPEDRWAELIEGAEVVRRLKALGFQYIALDLDATSPAE